jgi:hypothetical protein
MAMAFIVFLFFGIIVFMMGGFNDIIERKRRVMECRRKWRNEG